MLGPQPLAVRLIVSSNSGPLGVQSTLGIVARPDNGLTIDQAALGCSTILDDLACEPRFGNNGVRFSPAAYLSNLGLPTVLVLGLDLAPVVLPNLAAHTPCLLLPSPHALLTTYTYDQSVPNAVRPLSFWGQAVYLEQGALHTTRAFLINAQ